MRALMGMAWEIVDHTIDHHDLTTLGADLLRQEVAVSRQRLRKLLHVPVALFFSPPGACNDTVTAAVKALCFLGATTRQVGFASRAAPFELKRIRVDGSETLAAFADRLKA